MAIEYRTLPVPAFPEHTAMIAAGVVTFGVEYRVLDEATILAAYGPDARAKFDGVVPAGMGTVVEEDGLAVHVFGTDDGSEHLRFDCFDDAPHYHYLDPLGPRNVVVEYDRAANGPMVEWAMHALAARLADMLRVAGPAGAALAGRLDADAVAAALVIVRAEAERMLDVGEPVRV
jgi:hypothetical protein